jgi:hypothetical protein
MEGDKDIVEEIGSIKSPELRCPMQLCAPPSCQANFCGACQRTAMLVPPVEDKRH